MGAVVSAILATLASLFVAAAAPAVRDVPASGEPRHVGYVRVKRSGHARDKFRAIEIFADDDVDDLVMRAASKLGWSDVASLELVLVRRGGVNVDGAQPSDDEIMDALEKERQLLETHWLLSDERVCITSGAYVVAYLPDAPADAPRE